MITNSRDSTRQVLLIATVGGSPEAVAATVAHWRPARTLFIPSQDSCAQVRTAIELLPERGDYRLSEGEYEVHPVADAQDFPDCVATMRRLLTGEVVKWLQRSENHVVVADFTGGTKCMSAALALVASRWRSSFSYVGGSQRSKGGLGTVQTGSERVVHTTNPWNSLGYQAIEDAVTVFNNGGYAAAAALLNHAIQSASNSALRRELGTLKSVVEAYAAWDRFNFKKATRAFDDAIKNSNDLRSIFAAHAEELIRRLQHHRQHTHALESQKENPGVQWVIDLVENARRRADEERYDDAVARLYRSAEALAQIRLRDTHKLTQTKSISLADLPEALQSEWECRKREDGTVSLGLQDVYHLLRKLDDPLAHPFSECGLDDRAKSPLVARNNSILGHGFQPVSEKDYNRLRKAVGRLIEGCADSANQSEQLRWVLPKPESG